MDNNMNQQPQSAEQPDGALPVYQPESQPQQPQPAYEQPQQPTYAPQQPYTQPAQPYAPPAPQGAYQPPYAPQAAPIDGAKKGSIVAMIIAILALAYGLYSAYSSLTAYTAQGWALANYCYAAIVALGVLFATFQGLKKSAMTAVGAVFSGIGAALIILFLCMVTLPALSGRLAAEAPLGVYANLALITLSALIALLLFIAIIAGLFGGAGAARAMGLIALILSVVLLIVNVVVAYAFFEPTIGGAFMRTITNITRGSISSPALLLSSLSALVLASKK